MSKRLSPARDDGSYQVRKRDSKFKLLVQTPEEPESEPEPEPEPEPKKPESPRLTNEELLRKLSVLLDVPEKEVEKTPEEFDKENEEYQEDQQFIQQTYFDIVDNAVKTGDTNKRYSISTNTATAPSPPIPAGSWTNIHIAPTADNMCDLYNSFIELRMHVKFQASSTSKVSNLDSHGKPAVWVGYKDAMDCIESYQIVANGQVIYTQPHAIEESYITNLACPDTVKRRDVKGIWEKTDTVMTGGLIEFTKDKALNTYTYQKDIYLKIDIRRFLPLSGVKYLPAFVGNLELRVKFSTAGLVCVPMPWTDFIPDYKDQVAITTTLPTVTCAFTPTRNSLCITSKLMLQVHLVLQLQLLMLFL